MLVLTTSLHAAEVVDSASLERLRNTALRGSAEAQLEIGILYEFGFNMPKNEVNALAWYLRAVDQGNVQAITRRDKLKAKMNPQDIDAAEKLAREFAAQTPPAATPASPPPMAEPAPTPPPAAPETSAAPKAEEPPAVEVVPSPATTEPPPAPAPAPAEPAPAADTQLGPPNL